LKCLTYNGTKLNTLRYCNQEINTSVVIDALAACYRKVFMSQRNNNVANLAVADQATDVVIPLDSGYRHFSELLAFAQMVTLRRWTENAIHFDCFDNQSMCQQYYSTNEWSEMKMPIIAASALADLGPAIHCGMLFIPTLSPLNYVSDGTAFTPWDCMVSIGINPPLNGGVQLFIPPYYAVSGGTTATMPTIVLDATTPTAQQPNSNVVNDGTGARQLNYCVNMLAKSLYQQVGTIWNMYTAPMTFQQGVVHQHHPRFGSTSSILSYWEIAYPSNQISYLVPTDVWPQHGPELLNSTYIGRQCYQLIKYYSVLQQSSVQGIRGMTAPWRQSTNTTRIARFTRKLTTPISFDGFLDAAVDEAFSPESVFGKSLAIVEAKHKQKLVRLGPVTFVSVGWDRTRDCTWTNLLNESLVALTPMIARGARWGGTYICGGNPFCGKAAEAMFNWIVSNLNTSASDVSKPLDVKEGSEGKKVSKAINSAEVVQDEH